MEGFSYYKNNNGTDQQYYPNASNSSSSSSSFSSVVEERGKDQKKKKKHNKCGAGGDGGGRAVKLSTDPQSVAARERRHRISDRFKILQSMVPGGTKMDTVSMLEETIHYVKFLKAQIWLHHHQMTSTALNFTDDDIEPPSFLPTSTTCSTGTVPGALDQQTDLYLPDNYCAAQMSPAFFGWPYSVLLGDEAKPFDETMNY